MNIITSVTQDSLLSIARAAERLGISPWTIRAWAVKGQNGCAPKIRTIKLGARRMVPLSEVHRIICEGISHEGSE
jgi:predicted site-specific integrase-resolvase